jgi:SPP1 family predicted phage head-tail adaptor
MRAGNLRERVTIRQLAAGKDSIGQPATNWTDVVTLWADVIYKSGLETIKADAETSVVRASVRIRSRAGIAPTMQAVHGTKVMDIKAVLPSRHKGFVDLVCESANVQS